MKALLDLDAFVPEAQPVQFTDLAGRAIMLRIEDIEWKLSASTKWLTTRRLSVELSSLKKELASHTHKFIVSSMSFGASLYLMAHMDEFKRLDTLDQEHVTESDFRLLFGLISEICTKTEKIMTVDWLLDNLDFMQGVVLLSVAMKAVEEYMQSKTQWAAGKETVE
jgi:hypothetical protein